MDAVIEARQLSKAFTVRQRRNSALVQAVDGVTLRVGHGELVGLVGESGCGKSTLSRMLIGIESPDSGEVVAGGEPVRRDAEWRALRRRVQYVFQDPYGSLCPTMTVGETLVDALAINHVGDKSSRRIRAREILAQVGLSSSDESRYPYQFSGGQRQRIGLARALMLDPEVIICDEIVSGLDVSVQAQILNLLLDLHQRLNVGLLFISHDLRVVRYLCERVVVMYLGRIVEEGPIEAVFDAPRHPYTQALLASIPDHSPGAPTLRSWVSGEPPVLTDAVERCPFSPRCPAAEDLCRTTAPPIVDVDGHLAACHFAARPVHVADANVGRSEPSG